MSIASFALSTAKQLAVGDVFVPDCHRLDAEIHGWTWTVLSHEYTDRGDYSTVVGIDETDWTERFAPDEAVWIAPRPA